MRDSSPPNPYYNPELLGLEIVEMEDIGGPYEFDMWIVWRRLSDGKLFCGNDSGCSCPTPFDDWTIDSMDSIEEHIFKLKEEIGGIWKNNNDISDLKSYLRKVEALF